MRAVLPPDFDPQIYLRINPDVAAARMDPAVHWMKYGHQEGRRYLDSIAYRSGLAERALSACSLLEIGPFCNPVLVGPHVSYFDVLDHEALVDRARSIGYPVQVAPHIDFVSPIGDLSVVDRIFAGVLSAHCIEHQPDLVAHLQNVSRILAPGGTYYLIIPDKRYCFDAMIDTSNIAEIVAAHIEGRKVHSLASVIEHRALTTHNETGRHWQGAHADDSYEESILTRVRQSVAEWKHAAGGYIDVHAWQFTPASFRQNVGWLKELGLIDLEIEFVNETPRDLNEFTAALRKT